MSSDYKYVRFRIYYGRKNLKIIFYRSIEKVIKLQDFINKRNMKILKNNFKNFYGRYQ